MFGHRCGKIARLAKKRMRLYSRNGCKGVFYESFLFLAYYDIGRIGHFDHSYCKRKMEQREVGVHTYLLDPCCHVLASRNRRLVWEV